MKYKALAVLILAALVTSAADAQRPLLTADTKVQTHRVPPRLKTCPDQPQQQQQQRKQPSEFQRLYPEVRMIASAS
jgi:hypothetical protein